MRWEKERKSVRKHCPFSQIRLEKEAGDFTVTEHKPELYGHCKECRNAGKT